MTTLDRIKELAKKRDLSINQLESELGFARGYLYSWKRKTPGVDKVQSVAKYFNVSVDYLLGNTDTPAVTKSNSSPTNQNASQIGALFRSVTNQHNLTESEQQDLKDELTDIMEIRARRLREKRDGKI
jgi:transcriptional regulator with XRE-family HTH domain